MIYYVHLVLPEAETRMSMSWEESALKSNVNALVGRPTFRGLRRIAAINVILKCLYAEGYQINWSFIVSFFFCLSSTPFHAWLYFLAFATSVVLFSVTFLLFFVCQFICQRFLKNCRKDSEENFRNVLSHDHLKLIKIWYELRLLNYFSFFLVNFRWRRYSILVFLLE